MDAGGAVGITDLSGPWRASTADDDVRREGVGLQFDDSGWPEVIVPGHWRHSPNFADSDGPLLYRRSFDLAAPADGRRRWVTLDGVFYQADVWLDGAYLGDPEGYFFPHSFDITDLSRLGEEHVLAIEVTCNPQRQSTAKRNITGSLQHSDVIDPMWNPGGLWRPVRIHETGPVRIDRLRMVCSEANDARAHLHLHARLDADRSRLVTVRSSVDGQGVAEWSRSIAQGINEVDWNLDIDEPTLWWPWTLGEPRLTDVEVTISVDDEVSDRVSLRTGLREVRLQDWQLSVNGERLFVKGANIGPTRPGLADVSVAEVRRDVELARDIGLDLLRVNGHIGRTELYEAADELGILLWQDFPLQWGYARTVRREAVRQAREAVDLLGHHPSIALWCAHNEPQPVTTSRQRAAGSTIARHILQQQLPSWNRAILDRWVAHALHAADETRPVVSHSGVAPGLPTLDGSDSHLFFGWYHGEPRDLDGFAAAMPRMVRFVSEFGAQSAPADAAFLETEQWPHLDWQALNDRHQLQLEPLRRHVPPEDHPTFDSWRHATQVYQADLLRHQIETLRRLKYRPTGGFCFLGLFDTAPGVSWGVLDHQRTPKAALAAVVEACRPVIVVPDPLPPVVTVGDPLALDVHVVSDLRRVLREVVCTATLRWATGSHTWAWTGEVPPDLCVRVGTLQFVVPDVPGDLWLDLTLEHADATVTNRRTATVVARVGAPR